MGKRRNKEAIAFNIAAWISMSNDDLSVSKMESISSFIRAYHAQQAIEKMLKAAIIISCGVFVTDSKIQASKINFNCEYNNVNCAWEIKENDFCYTHDLATLWKMLVINDENNFKELTDTQADFFEKIGSFVI